MKSQKINVQISDIVIDSLNDFIDNGDSWDITPSTKKSLGLTVEIKLTSLLKFLYSAYGDKETEYANYLADTFETFEVNKKFLSIRTTNQQLVDSKINFEYKIITAMVYMGIPIKNYFDGRKLIM